MTTNKKTYIERIRSVKRKLGNLPASPDRKFIAIHPSSPTSVLPEKFQEVDNHMQELYRRIDELEEILLALADRGDIEDRLIKVLDGK